MYPKTMIPTHQNLDSPHILIFYSNFQLFLTLAKHYKNLTNLEMSVSQKM